MKRPLALLLGPAFVAAVAYVDPGNVAANITAGSRYGYLLVWVLVLASAMAVFIQYQSAKLGVVTRKSLPKVLGTELSRTPKILYWLQAELVAIATDLAEVIGGALALQLLFGLPLLWGAIITGAVSLMLLVFQGRTQRTFERIITGLLLVIAVGFVCGLFIDPPNPGDVAKGLVPRFEGVDTLVLAASMLGATVMPHAIYLHSSLVNDRFQEEDRDVARLLHATKIDVVLALLIAGTVNVALLVLAANSLRGVPGTDTIEGAHAAIATAFGPAVGIIFAIGLLASGLASTSVGSYAGAEVFSGLMNAKIPLLVQRLITLVPAVGIIAIGVEPTQALVVSQALLSMGIPFAIIPLFLATSSRRLMGEYVNRPATTAVAWAMCALVVVLNVALLAMMAMGY